jgi:hypothetical protein
MTANAWVMASAVLVSIVAATQSSYADLNPVVANVPVRICAMYISQVGPQTLDVRTMEREVNQIWAPYGVTLEGLAEPCKTPGDGPMLKVRLRRMENIRPAGIPRGTLGNIYFVAGRPTPLIDLWADEALRVMGGGHVGFNQGLNDPRVRLEMGRLLGRSLAHELGHYLLESRIHTEEGLMRRVYEQRDGKAKAPGSFSLDEEQVAALTRTVSGWRLASAERETLDDESSYSYATVPSPDTISPMTRASGSPAAASERRTSATSPGAQAMIKPMPILNVR